MKTSLLLALVSSGLVLGGTLGLKETTKPVEKRDAEILVQVAGGVKGLTKKQITDRQNIVLNQIKNYITGNYQLKERYYNTVNAFMIKVPSAYVNQIRNLDSVSKLNYNEKRFETFREKDYVPLTEGEGGSIDADEKVNYSARTMNVPENTKEGEGVFIAILDTGGMVNANVNGVPGTTHKAFTALDSGVAVKETKESIQEKIRNAPDFHGKDDATHSTYWNNKVPFYYDYGGTGNSGPGEESYNVYSPGEEHGMHVASIAAGNDPDYKGIAPKAQVAVMKVFTVSSGGSIDGENSSAGAYDSCILKALEDCAVLGVDVINMSFGSDLNDVYDADDVITTAFNNLRNKGCILNIAAGNSGRETWSKTAIGGFALSQSETGILSDNCTVEDTFTVASTHAEKSFFESGFVIGDFTINYRDQIISNDTTTYEPEFKLTDLMSIPGHEDGKFEYVKVPGLGSKDDFNSLPEGSVEGRIAVIDRGELTFVEKINNAKKKGAIAVCVIDNDVSNTDFSFRMDLSGDNPKIPVILTLNRDRDVFGEAGTIKECQVIENKLLNNPLNKTVSDFSSDGLVSNLCISPEIATPGSSIKGAVYKNKDGLESDNLYEYYDGTSMACPNMTGVAALLLSENLDDPNYRSTFFDRVMSTATPMKDKFGTNFETVRRQGAGLVNVQAALNSKQYLEGNCSTELNRKAKIQLGNTNAIKNGNVDLSFSIYNEGDADVEYTATSYIYRPEVIKVDNENYTTILDKEVQANYDHLIGTATNTVSVNKNSNKIVTLPTFSIPGEEKTYLDSKFENGCVIEGFVVLEADGYETLSIPFLGYYGDFNKQAPVEPFEWEKQEGVTYQSDLMNEFIKTNVGKVANFESDWVEGYYKDFESIKVDDLLTCETSLRLINDSNGNSLFRVKTDPYARANTTEYIYAGNNGYANTMIITQFVTRTVRTNTIKLTNKATGEVVLTDHMYDTLANYGEEDENTLYSLLKSLPSADYFESSVYAHRAYSLIPMYEVVEETDAKGKKKQVPGEKFADGEYLMTFDYVLESGGTYHLEYTLVIDSDKPTVKNIEKVEGDNNLLKVSFNESKLTAVFINDKKQRPEQAEDGTYYGTIDKAKLKDKDIVLIKAIDMASGQTLTLTHFSDTAFMIENADLTTRYDFTYTKELTDVDEFTYTYALELSGKSAKLKTDTFIIIKLDDSLANMDITASEKTGDSFVECEVTVMDGYARINTKSTTVKIKGTKKPTPPKKGCGGSLVAGSALVSLITLAGGVVILLKRKKEN